MTDRTAENIAALIFEADDLVDIDPETAREYLRIATPVFPKVQDAIVRNGLAKMHAQVANRIADRLGINA